jgi:hypothetical protein
VVTGLFLGFTICLAAQENPNPPASLPPPAAASSEPADTVSIQRGVEYGVRGGEKLLLDVYQPAESGSKRRTRGGDDPRRQQRLAFETLALPRR